jgi:hypothetical protein
MDLSRDTTPPRPGPKMEFLTPRNIQPVSWVVCSRQISAHHVHWIGACTAPCAQPKAHCEHCERSCPRRWKGYVHVIAMDGRKECFLCLTPGAGYELLNSLPRPYDIRGRKLTVYRSGKAATSLLIATLDLNFTNHGELPLERDPGPYLDNVFRKVLRKPDVA